MQTVTQITRVDGVPVSAKFESGVIRHYDLTRKEWIASENETAAIMEAIGTDGGKPYYYREDLSVYYHDGVTLFPDGSPLIEERHYRTNGAMAGFIGALVRKGYEKR